MQNQSDKGKLSVINYSLILYLDSYRNPLLEGEVVVGILLRVYNNNPIKKLPFENESFLRSLMNWAQKSYNEYWVFDTFISKDNQDNENEEEKNSLENESSQEPRYYSASDIDESKLEHLDPDLIEDYKKSRDKLVCELTTILTTVLINIKLNGSAFSAASEEQSSNNNTLSAEFWAEMLQGEINKGLLNIFERKGLAEAKCTLLQILYLFPQIVHIKAVIGLLKNLDKDDDSAVIEAQLIMVVLLRILLEAKNSIQSLEAEDFDILTEVGLHIESTAKMFELILNFIKKQGVLGAKIKELLNTKTSINWSIVDDSTEIDNSTGPSFGFNKHQR